MPSGDWFKWFISGIWGRFVEEKMAFGSRSKDHGKLSDEFVLDLTKSRYDTKNIFKIFVS